MRSEITRITRKTLKLVSGFHRAFLQSVNFIDRLNALDFTKLEVKIYVV